MEQEEETCLGFKVIYQTVSNTLSVSKKIKLATENCQIQYVEYFKVYFLNHSFS